MNEQERRWLNNASSKGGSFLKTFADACFAADDANYQILRPALAQMIEKYPRYAEGD